MSVLRQEDLQIDVVRTDGGDFVVYRHIKLGSSFQCPLGEARRGRHEFIWQTMRSVVMNPELAAKISTEAATLVSTARALDADGLTKWTSSESHDEIFIAILELARRGMPIPQDALYANPSAMNDPMIRDYLLGIYDPSTGFRQC